MMPFTAVASAIAAGAARDLFVLQAPATKSVTVREIEISADVDATDHLPYELYKGTAFTTNGSSVTITPHRPDAFPVSGTHPRPDETYAGVCVALPLATTKSPTGPLFRRGAPLIYVWEWTEDDGWCITLGPGECLIIRQAGTTTVATSLSLAFDVT